MITIDDLETFAEGDGELEKYYGSPDDAFADMNDELILHDRFAELYGEEQERLFQYAYRHWSEHLTALGVDWLNVFIAWESEG